jgi:membrane protein YqaA with SNARE-associated domain
MENIEPYLMLAADNFMSASIIPPYHPVIYDSMLLFGGYDNIWVFIISFITYICAAALNYGAGGLLLLIPASKANFEKNDKYMKYKKYLHNYFFWLPFLIFLPSVGTLVGIISGFLQLNFRSYMYFAVSGSFLYFIFDLWLKNMIM